MVKITMARSKVKSRVHHDVAHLHPLTNVHTKYQIPTPYGLWGKNLLKWFALNDHTTHLEIALSLTVFEIFVIFHIFTKSSNKVAITHFYIEQQV